MSSFIRQEQNIKNSDSYKDNLLKGKELESNSVSLESDLNAIRTLVKSIIGKDNWYDSPDISINDLFLSSNRLWYKIKADIGEAIPTQSQDTLGIKGASPSILSVNVEKDGDQNKIQISVDKNVYKTIQTDNGQIVANSAQDEIVFVGGDEISTTIGSHQLTITFSGTDPQDYWDLIVANTRSVGGAIIPAYPGGSGWSTTTPTITQDTLIITGSNGIQTSFSQVASPETDTLIFSSQNFTSGIGDVEFSTVIINSLDSKEIIFSDTDNKIVGDLDNFNFDYANNYFGIGLSSPEYNLHIKGSIKNKDISYENVDNIDFSLTEEGYILLEYGEYIISFIVDPSTNYMFKLYEKRNLLSGGFQVRVSQPASEDRVVKDAIIKGNYLITISDPYTSTNSLGYLDIWDLTDLQNISLITTLSNSSFKGSSKIEVLGQYILFSSNTKKLNIINLLDPETPTIHSQSAISDGVGGYLRIKDNYAIVLVENTGTVGHMYLYNLDNIDSGISTYDLDYALPFACKGLEFYGDKGFSISNNGLIIYNFSLDDGDLVDVSLYFTTINDTVNFIKIINNKLYISYGNNEQYIDIYKLGETSSSPYFSFYETINTSNYGIININDLICTSRYLLVTSFYGILIMEVQGSLLSNCSIQNSIFGNVVTGNGLEINNLLDCHSMWIGPGGIHIDKGSGIVTDSNLVINGNLIIKENTDFVSEKDYESTGLDIVSGDLKISVSKNKKSSFYEENYSFSHSYLNSKSKIYGNRIISIYDSFIKVINKGVKKDSQYPLIKSLSSSYFKNGSVSDFDVVGDIVYYVNENYDHPICINIKNDIEIYNTQAVSGSTSNKIIKIYGNIALVGFTDANEVKVYDISNPTKPEYIFSHSSDGTGITGCVSIDYFEKRVFIAFKGSGIDPGKILVLKAFSGDRYLVKETEFDTDTDILFIKVFDNKLLSVNQSRFVRIYNITTPSTSSAIGNYDTLNVITNAFVSGGYLWIVTSSKIRCYEYSDYLESPSTSSPIHMFDNDEYFYLSREVTCITSDSENYLVSYSSSAEPSETREYNLSRTEIDFIRSGSVNSNNILVNNNLNVKNIIESNKLSIGKDGARVQGYSRILGKSSIKGALSIGDLNTEEQFYTKNSILGIVKNDTIITDLYKESLSSIYGVTQKITSGGFSYFIDTSSEIITLSDFRYDNIQYALTGGSFPNPFTVTVLSMALKGDILCITHDGGELEIYDIGVKSSSNTYTLLSSTSISFDYNKSVIASNFLILSIDNLSQRFEVFDITDPENPSSLSVASASFGTYGPIIKMFMYKHYFVWVSNKTGTGSYINICSISDSGTITVEYSIDYTDDPSISDIIDITYGDGYFYILTSDGVSDKIITVDVRDLDNISVLDSITLSYSYMKKIVAKGRYILASDNTGGNTTIVLIDISDPANIQEINESAFNTAGFFDLDFYGNKLICGTDEKEILFSEILGYRGQNGIIGSISVDDLIVSEDAIINKEFQVGSYVNIGKGGLYVDKGAGTSTDGPLFVSGKIGIGTTILEDDVNISNIDIAVDNGVTYTSNLYCENIKSEILNVYNIDIINSLIFEKEYNKIKTLISNQDLSIRELNIKNDNVFIKELISNNIICDKMIKKDINLNKISFLNFQSSNIISQEINSNIFYTNKLYVNSLKEKDLNGLIISNKEIYIKDISSINSVFKNLKVKTLLSKENIISKNIITKNIYSNSDVQIEGVVSSNNGYIGNPIIFYTLNENAIINNNENILEKCEIVKNINCMSGIGKKYTPINSGVYEISVYGNIENEINCKEIKIVLRKNNIYIDSSIISLDKVHNDIYTFDASFVLECKKEDSIQIYIEKDFFSYIKLYKNSSIMVEKIS